MSEERRGLRLPFDGVAEVFLESSPGAGIAARVTELSLRGCFLEISGSFKEQQRVQVKIFASGAFFEAPADIIYVRPNGIGVTFDDIKPHLRSVLQKWILKALDGQTE